MSWWDDLANAVGGAANAAGNAIGGAASYVWDGITHPVQAIQSTALQIEAASHGFNSVDSYMAWMAKQPQGTIKPQSGFDEFLKTNPVGMAIAPVLANGVTVGTSGVQAGMPSAASSIPHTADQVTNAVTQGQQNYNNPAPNSYTDAQAQAAINQQVASQPAPTISLQSPAQVGQVANNVGGGGQLVWTGTRWEMTPSNSVGMTPIGGSTPQGPNQVATTPSNLNNADLRVGDHQTVNGVYQTWNGTSWNNGNSAAASGPAAPTPTTPPLQVNTTMQNPLATEWQERFDTQLRQYLGVGLSAEDARARVMANLGPKPSPTVPLVTPQAQNPAPAGAPSGAGAAVGTAAAAAALEGLDPNIAALLLSGGGSALATYLAAHEQAQASYDASGAQQQAIAAALAEQKRQFDVGQLNLKPWIEAGQQALPQLEQQISSYDPTKLTMDPGFSFRLNEGVEALQNSAAAKGGLLSGNTMKAIQDYGQNQASQEYQNAFNRYQTTYGTRLNSLQSLAGVGQTATTQSNSNGQNYANQVGNLATANGNAQAAGITGAANANASGYVGGGSILNSMLGQYMNYNQGQQSMNMFKSMFGG